MVQQFEWSGITGTSVLWSPRDPEYIFGLMPRLSYPVLWQTVRWFDKTAHWLCNALQIFTFNNLLESVLSEPLLRLFFFYHCTLISLSPAKLRSLFSVCPLIDAASSSSSSTAMTLPRISSASSFGLHDWLDVAVSPWASHLHCRNSATGCLSLPQQPSTVGFPRVTLHFTWGAVVQLSCILAYFFSFSLWLLHCCSTWIICSPPSARAFLPPAIVSALYAIRL